MYSRQFLGRMIQFESVILNLSFLLPYLFFVQMRIQVEFHGWTPIAAAVNCPLQGLGEEPCTPSGWFLAKAPFSITLSTDLQSMNR